MREEMVELTTFPQHRHLSASAALATDAPETLKNEGSDCSPNTTMTTALLKDIHVKHR